jgi:glutathione S-transferase
MEPEPLTPTAASHALAAAAAAPPSSSAAGAPAPVPASSSASLRRVLYWGSGSPPAWRALLCLTEKGLPFRSEQITFESGVLKTPPMLTINPRGLVPILVDGEVRMYESLAILQYLELTYPSSPPLLPVDRMGRARALMRMEEANNLSTAAGEVVYYLRRTPTGDINEEYLAAKKDALHTELALWESYLVGAVRTRGGGGVVGWWAAGGVRRGWPRRVHATGGQRHVGVGACIGVALRWTGGTG